MTILRTGAEVPDSFVPAVIITLQYLLKEEPVALYELAMLARDPSHQPYGGTGEVLRTLGLTDGTGKIRDSTRAVILAAIEGEGLGMHLRSPYAACSGTEASDGN